MDLMKRAVASFAVLLAVSLAILPHSSAAAGTPTTRHAATQPTTEISPGVYKSEKFGFKLTVPAEWERVAAAEKAPVVLVVEKEKPAAAAAPTMVLVQCRPAGRAKLTDIAKSMGEAAKQSDPKAEASPVSSAVLGGTPGNQVAVVSKIKGVSIRTIYVLAVKDKRLYILSLLNDPASPPMTDTILKGFEFTN